MKKDNQQEIQELKVFLKDLTSENQKFCYQIEQLNNKLNSKTIEYEMLELLNKQLEHQIKPFQDEYFKGLDNVAIAELAKKSIRITAENCKLEDILIKIKEICLKQNLKTDLTACEILEKIQLTERNNNKRVK